MQLQTLTMDKLRQKGKRQHFLPRFYALFSIDQNQGKDNYDRIAILLGSVYIFDNIIGAFQLTF